MELSLFLGKVMGLYFIIMGLFVLIRGKALKSLVEEYRSAGRPLMFTVGSLVLVLGLLLVVSHNIWSGGWVVIITVVSWLILLKGIMALFFTDTLLRFARSFSKKNVMVVWAIVILVIGVYLAVQGFGV